MNKYSLDLQIDARESDPDHAAVPDRIEEGDTEAELRARVEVHRSEGRFALATLWRRASDRPNSWDRIETFQLR